jgi:hypothetical protein
MSVRKTLSIGCLLAATAIGLSSAAAAGKAKQAEPAVPLTAAGEKLQARYAEMFKALKAAISKAVPAGDERKKAAFQEAGEAIKKATAEANAAGQPLKQVQAAKGLVDHAKGKWIGGAEKGIAQANAALEKATTEAQREAAKKDLAKWQANKDAGLKALKERQEALDKVKSDEAKLTRALQAAQAALAQAQTNELMAAKAMLADVTSVLSNDKLDAKLVKCAVLAEATPRGLAEFAQQDTGQESLVEKFLADTALMKEMLEAGGAKDGKYGQAMKIYSDIQKASPRAKGGIFHRLALGTSLEHAAPIGQRNAVAEKDAPAVVDPVKRYLHYEKAYLDGELDPAFPTMTAWECRLIVNSSAPDHILAWGREMLRNYRPDHILNPDYGWRYSGAVRTDVAYRHSNEYTDTDSLGFFQNVIKNGGICGRRAFFGRFILQSFGIPSVERPQVGHAALAHWTPTGWIVNLGGGWGCGAGKGVLGLTDADFVLETQVRKHPKEYEKSLRAQWVGDALGEPKRNSFQQGSGGLWNVLAQFQKKAIVAEAKPAQLAALGTELGEANESAETKATAVAKATVTDADKKIVTGPSGAITIPAAACSGGNQLVKSFLGGQQMICGKAFGCEVDVPQAGKYALTARVVTVHGDMHLQLSPNGAKSPIDVAIPFTVGSWETTRPVEVTLVAGKNVLSFSKPTTGFALKELTLTPLK